MAAAATEAAAEAAAPGPGPSLRDQHQLNKAAFSASIFKRGQKAELFGGGGQEGGADGAADEAAELAGKLDELHTVWALERTGRDLAAAIWRPELGLAEVVLQKGKLLAHMGCTRGPKLYLFIEEAVYLIDRANLLLFLDGSSSNSRGGARRQRQQPQQRLLSLQEATDLMVRGCGVPLDRYLVFCKLLRAGYIVQRHGARWVLGPGDDLAAVAPEAAAAVGAARRGTAAAGAGPEVAGPAAAAATGKAAAAGKAAAGEAAPAARSLPAGPAKKRRVDAQQEQQQRRSGRWWVTSGEVGPAAVDAPAQQQPQPPEKGEQHEQQPEKEHQQQQQEQLEKGEELQPQQADDNHAPPALTAAATDAPPQQQQQPAKGEQEAPAPAAAAAAVGSHASWCGRNPWMAGLPAGFLDSLPRCQVLPTPAQRAAAEFPRLAPLQPIPLADLRPLGGPEAGRHLLHYDVFLSNARFSRKQPGRPAFAVAVLPCAAPPTPAVMAAADAAAGGTPVRFSTVEIGDICFYGATHVELRSILR